MLMFCVFTAIVSSVKSAEAPTGLLMFSIGSLAISPPPGERLRVYKKNSTVEYNGDSQSALLRQFCDDAMRLGEVCL